jgi:hypothetical protein
VGSTASSVVPQIMNEDKVAINTASESYTQNDSRTSDFGAGSASSSVRGSSLSSG